VKRLLIILFLAIGITAYCQDSPFKGFFRPLEQSIFEREVTTDGELKVDETTSFWLFRPVVTLSAMQFILEKPVKVATLSSLGTGISYSHFVNSNGAPYMNYAFNFLVLFGTEIADVSPLELSLAATVSAFQYINVGAGYNFASGKAFIITGIQFNFNE